MAWAEGQCITPFDALWLPCSPQQALLAAVQYAARSHAGQQTLSPASRSAGPSHAWTLGARTLAVGYLGSCLRDDKLGHYIWSALSLHNAHRLRAFCFSAGGCPRCAATRECLSRAAATPLWSVTSRLLQGSRPRRSMCCGKSGFWRRARPASTSLPYLTLMLERSSMAKTSTSWYCLPVLIAHPVDVQGAASLRHIALE